jgi:DNA excision repair protein ERCC-4
MKRLQALVLRSRQLPVFLVDTREQRPYEFPCSRVQTLTTGDYSIAGFEDRIAIERKTKEDAYSSLGYDRARFQREVERLAQLHFGAIVIESSLPDFLYPPPFSRLHPRAAIGTLLAWSVRFGIHIHFVGDRAHGQALTGSLLEKFWRYQQVSNHAPVARASRGIA